MGGATLFESVCLFKSQTRLETQDSPRLRFLRGAGLGSLGALGIMKYLRIDIDKRIIIDLPVLQSTVLAENVHANARTSYQWVSLARLFGNIFQERLDEYKTRT